LKILTLILLLAVSLPASSQTYLDKLDSVSPKSITAGILFYVVKYKLELKQPSKSKISQVVKVCIPTINKVVSLILENLIL
jgi:hypothetical protein